MTVVGRAPAGNRRATAAVRGDGPDVLMTVTRLRDNPYPELWAEAMRAAGARLEHLGFRALVRARRRGRAWVNLQWPEWALSGNTAQALRRLGTLLALCVMARLAGHRILLTVHNVRGHDVRHPLLERVMWWSLGALSTHLHTFTAVGAREFVGAVPPARSLRPVVIPHGDYGPVVGPAPSREQARAGFGLGPEHRVFLVFGRLRAYKGLDAVLDAFASGHDPQDRLLVCGAPADVRTEASLKTAAESDPRVVVVPRFLEQTELTAALVAADVVVAPYTRVTNSGSALMALTLARPIVLPRTPVFEELAHRVGPGWVHLVDGRLRCEDLAAAADSQARETSAPDLTWCSWDAVTAALAELFAAPEGLGGRHD